MNEPIRVGAGQWGTDSSMEVLAALAKRRGDAVPGVGFARSASARPEKDAARQSILALLGRDHFPGELSILTMPGLEWTFERQLLRLRERSRVLTRNMFPERTFIRAIESEPLLYTAALRSIPMTRTGFVTRTPPPYSAYALATQHIQRFDLCRFEHLARQSDRVFDAAWLDFTGPLTAEILETLPLLWKRIRRLLVVTGLAARWSGEVGARLARAPGGDACGLLAQLLPGSIERERHPYSDTVPMFQVALERAP